MRAAAAGDRGAFTELVARYSSKVFHLARALVRDDATAEDVLQDTFLAAWRTAASYRGDGEVASWLYAIARHGAHRRGRRADQVATDDVDLEALGAAAGWGQPDVTTFVTRAEDRAALEAALQGLRDAASSGADGFPLEDVGVTLTGVGTADGADPLIGCRAAAAEAFRRAVAAASPTRLEPIMSVEVTVDEEFLGAIIGDLNQRRGQIQDVAVRGVKQVVTALVPLRAMFGYSTRMRSLSEGRATFMMKFHAYDTLAG